MNTTIQAFRKKLYFLTTLLLAVSAGQSQMRQIHLDETRPENELLDICFYSESEGYVAFQDWIGFTVDNGRTFTRKPVTLNNVEYGPYSPSVNLTYGFGIAGVKAFDRNTLIAYGGYSLVPSILYSNNGGTTWKLVYHSQYNPAELSTGIKDLIFPHDNLTGFAVDADRVLKTIDGGQNWTVAHTRPGNYFTNIIGVDNTTLFAFSTNYLTSKLLRSTNGGVTWSTITVPEGKIQSVFFLTANTGWMTTYSDKTYGEYVFKTINGGATWTLQNDPHNSPFCGVNLKFFDENLGFGLYGRNTVFKTSDGGKIWEPLPRDNDFSYLGYSHNDLHFWNSNQFWAGGGHGFLELTNNGGGTTLPKAYFKIDTTGVAHYGNVNLSNYSRPGYQYKWYVNNIFIGSGYDISYKHAINSASDTITLIVSYNNHSDTLTKYHKFYVPPYPVLKSFFPASGSTGTAVTINGENLNGVTGISFGNVPASSFKVISSSKIIAVVGPGETGGIGVTSPYGTFTTPGFTYTAPPASRPPSISSFSPAAGHIGTLVTITGSDFDPEIKNNIVLFGSARAVVLFASTTQLTCTVPAGASFKPLSVLNTSTSLTGHAARPFHVTFDGGEGNFTGSSFRAMVTYQLGTETGYPDYVEGTDLDGDNKPELMVAFDTFNSDSIGIYLNTSTGDSISFAPKINLDRIYGFGVAVFGTGDLDGDGMKDIVADAGGGSLSAYLNTSTPGNISFLPRLPLSQAKGTDKIFIEDLDNDGRNDIVTGGHQVSQISLLRNTSSIGNLSFASASLINVGKNSLNLAIGDFDNDGKKDIAVFSNGSVYNPVFKWYKNTSSVGNFNFSAGPEVTLQSFASQGYDIRLADYDGDEKLDVIILTNSNLFIFRNTSTVGTISFADMIDYPLTGTGQGSSVDNLNGDAKSDVLRGSWGDRHYWLYKNISKPGNILTELPIKVEGKPNLVPYTTNTADFNLDGKTDIILSGSNDRMISVYKNAVGEHVIYPICERATAFLSADVTGTTYQWQADDGGGFVNIVNDAHHFGATKRDLNVTNTPLAFNNVKYRCVVDSTLYTSVFILEVAVYIPPEVTITTESTSVCGGIPIKFTARVDKPGYSEIFRWQVNGVDVGTNSETYITKSLSNGDDVSVLYEGHGECGVKSNVESNVVTMNVAGGIPSVTISTPTNIICDSGAVSFTATPVNPGTASYEWQVNGVNVGGNSTSFILDSPHDGDEVKVIMTASGYCIPTTPVSSNKISISVKPTVEPSVSITTPTTNTCPGTAITFTATPVNGGLSPYYQWKVNGENVGTNQRKYSSSNLANNDEVWVEMLSNAACVSPLNARSNVIAMTIIDSSPTATMTISGNTTVYTGQSSTINGVSTNGGMQAAYQWQDSTQAHTWQDIAGAVTTSIDYAPPHTGAKLRCRLTTSNTCTSMPMVYSNVLVFGVSPVTAVDNVPAASLGIRIYPNPVNEIFTIDTLRLSENWQTLEILSIDGKHKLLTKMIGHQSHVSIKVTHLPSGFYIALLRRKSGKSAYLKFIKL